MDRAELEAYLHRHIPLSAAMGVSVVAANSEAVQLAAPLAPNLNHELTAFGGSLSAVCMLAAWSLCRIRVDALPDIPHLVIASSEMRFLRPVSGDFTAECVSPGDPVWTQMLADLRDSGRGRIRLAVAITFDGRTAATLRGDFVALHN